MQKSNEQPIAPLHPFSTARNGVIMSIKPTELEDELDLLDARTFNGTCGIVSVEANPEHAVSTMHIEERLFQPFGFLHGGATLALLEAVASRAVDLRADLTTERPFGINVNVWHKKRVRALGRIRILIVQMMFSRI
jgi:uncharacterized protein (TIGR00369 family)